MCNPRINTFRYNCPFRCTPTWRIHCCALCCFLSERVASHRIAFHCSVHSFHVTVDMTMLCAPMPSHQLIQCVPRSLNRTSLSFGSIVSATTLAIFHCYKTHTHSQTFFFHRLHAETAHRSICIICRYFQMRLQHNPTKSFL